MRQWLYLWLLLLAALTVLLAGRVNAAQDQKPLAQSDMKYSYGDPVPVSCLKRSIDTGEHVTDSEGRLQYIPFPTCEQTGRPLELYFGVEREVNCTVDFVSDEFYHLLEFYVHNDAPLTCRIPTRPLSLQTYLDPANQVGALGSESSAYTPLIIALSGILQLSHVHVANNLNILLHAAPRSLAPGVIDAAVGYSVSATTRTHKVVIGDALPLRFSVRWYPSSSLPSGWQGVGGHVTGWTMIYCLLSAGTSAAFCVTYFRGFELPRRLRSHGRDRVGIIGADRPRGGYGYGVGTAMANGLGSGWGYSGGGGAGPGPGKND